MHPRPPPPPSKERLLRSIINRDSNNTAFGTPLCKNAGYAPEASSLRDETETCWTEELFYMQVCC